MLKLREKLSLVEFAIKIIEKLRKSAVPPALWAQLPEWRRYFLPFCLLLRVSEGWRTWKNACQRKEAAWCELCNLCLILKIFADFCKWLQETIEWKRSCNVEVIYFGSSLLSTFRLGHIKPAPMQRFRLEQVPRFYHWFIIVLVSKKLYFPQFLCSH